MPRPGDMSVADKTKDFKGTIIRLFNSLDKWRKLLILSVVLALISAILSTIAPNKLSDITNVISDGIKPNSENLHLVSEEIYKNVITSYLSINSSSDNYLINNSKLDEENMSLIIKEFNKLNDNTKEVIVKDINVKGVTISTKDQIRYIDLTSNIDKNNINEDTIKIIDKLPKSIKKLVSPKLDMDLLNKEALILAIIYLFGSLFGYVQGIIMAYVANGYSRGLRSDISTKINKLPLKYFDRHETGDLLSRVTNDVDTICINMHQSVSSLVSNLTLFLGSIVMMFVTNWIMALTAILSSIFGFLISFILLKKSQKYFVRRQEELGKLNGHIEEIFSGHNVVKTYNGEKAALEEFDKINSKLYDCNRKSQFLSGIMQPIMAFIGNFGYVMVCVVGAILVMNDMTSFGTIVAFMIYIRLFTNPLSQIAQALTALQSTAAAAERVFEFMDEEEMVSDSDKNLYLHRHKVKGNIEFKNVKFGYDPDRTIIKNFNAKVKSGQKIAIVGPTGAGKTTMVNLLMKFYDINSGDIIIDGYSTKDLTRENIHRLFVMVLQDTWLFDGTIKENIRFNQENVTDEEIWNACKTVGIDHFIKTLPNGIDANVSESDSISSGQKQLLTIARGMVEDAPFLILDEATSNVDTRTEELVQKAMDKLMVGRTSFIIAHRLSTIKNSDLILVMDEGNIVEQGNHEELIKKNGFYAKLYNSQFQK